MDINFKTPWYTIDLKEPCCKCHCPELQLYEFQNSLVLRCNKMLGCKMVNELKSDADAEEPMSSKQDNDPVNHPSHYTQGGKEVIEIIQEVCSLDEFIGYCKGNILKYLARRNFKGFYKQDLQKADWYLDYLLNCVQILSPAYRIHMDSSIRQNLPDTVRDSCKKSFNIEWCVADAYMFALQNNWANASRSLKVALEMIKEN